MTSARYSLLQSELRVLEGQFSQHASRSPALYAHRVCGDASVAGWKMFAAANPLPDDWQESHVLAGGAGVIRVHGEPSEMEVFPPFHCCRSFCRPRRAGKAGRGRGRERRRASRRTV
jgi:hypothetical protein